MVSGAGIAAVDVRGNLGRWYYILLYSIVKGHTTDCGRERQGILPVDFGECFGLM